MTKKTAMQDLIDELKSASKVGENPFIHTTINIVIEMAESKLETEKQQIIEANRAGVDMVIDDKKPFITGNQYYTETFEQ